MTVRHLPASERRAVPWKNGGGVTREIAAFPEGAGFDAFAWRLSMAEVASEGPFSRFEGIDRVLTVLSGELELRLGKADAVTLTPTSDPFAFAGDQPCHGAPRSGAVTDFNVMTRRGAARAEVRRVQDAAPLTARGDRLFVLALETGRVGDVQLERYGGLLADRGDVLAPDGPVRLLAVDLFES